MEKSFRHALNDGEDYELLFTVCGESVDLCSKLDEFRDKFGLRCTVIGKVVENMKGVELFRGGRFYSKLEKGGFEHF